MYRYLAALLGVAACATHAQAQRPSPPHSGPILSLSEALHLADQVSPEIDAADAGTRAAGAARQVAGLRPNPSMSADIENVGGSAAYDKIEAPKQTVSLGLPLELGGKRSARIAVADAQSERTRIDRQAAGQDLHLAVTQAYIDAQAADRRVESAWEQAKIAAEALHTAQVRVQAGRASPLEAQRAEVLRINADAALDRATRLAALARAHLARRIGRPVTAPLDGAWFDQVDRSGPQNLPARNVNLVTARAGADARVAAAQVRLARSQRVPDVTVRAGLRRLPINNDVAAVFGISVPLPLFNNGSAAFAQASAEQDRADALGRAALRDYDQTIDQAEADLANAAQAARTASGPSLAAAQEAARIARIGYREGKFGQLDLLEAERTLAETRSAAIDALAAYHVAQAQLDRLTATTSKDCSDALSRSGGIAAHHCPAVGSLWSTSRQGPCTRQG